MPRRISVDNLTHSLVGAVLGRTGLKRLTGYAMPALIISANLPDIDSWIARPLGLEPIAFHRGFTHGVGGLMLLPFLTAAMVMAWERLQPSKSEPVRFWPLVLLCFLGSLSHSLLDLLNNYGIRLLDPFSYKQFYQDTLFIVDPWIWLMLILGLEFSWRAERLRRNWQRPAMCAFAAGVGYFRAQPPLLTPAVGGDPPPNRKNPPPPPNAARGGSPPLLG